jgi:hypothetical protein
MEIGIGLDKMDATVIENESDNDITLQKKPT